MPRALILLAAAALLAGCAGGGRGGGSLEQTAAARAEGVYKVGNPYVIAGRRFVPRVQPGYSEVGLASWYGPKFHGRRTANGEVFDQYALTAAHRTLPLPSRVRVTNLGNGREVVLRVNDRGPFVGDRIIDLSRRAAQLLGTERSGVGTVRVDLIDSGPHLLARSLPPLPEPAAGRPARGRLPDGIFVQVGAFSEPGNAERMAARMEAFGRVTMAGDGGDSLRRVLVGPLPSAAEADSLVVRLQREGFDTRIVMR